MHISYSNFGKATLKSRRSGASSTFKVILIRLLKRFFFEVATLLFCLTSSPCHTLSLFCLTPSPCYRPVTYFLNGPLQISTLLLTGGEYWLFAFISSRNEPPHSRLLFYATLVFSARCFESPFHSLLKE